jgi:hypothetical protein
MRKDGALMRKDGWYYLFSLQILNTYRKVKGMHTQQGYIMKKMNG